MRFQQGLKNSNATTTSSPIMLTGRAFQCLGAAFARSPKVTLVRHTVQGSCVFIRF